MALALRLALSAQSVAISRSVSEVVRVCDILDLQLRCGKNHIPDAGVLGLFKSDLVTRDQKTTVKSNCLGRNQFLVFALGDFRDW